MAQRVTQNRLDEFIGALETAGGSAGNQYLRETLEWDEEFYWKVQGRLIEAGRITPGRGRGGSVRFTEAQAVESEISYEDCKETQINEHIYYNERDLYPDLKESIETKWINKFALDDVMIDETHSRGSRDTGGTFTRPDLTAVGIRRFMYLPKKLEVIIFEVKHRDCINILGVLEAIAHRESAHRAYTIYPISRSDFDVSTEMDRIMDLAQKYGIGILLTENPRDVETWEIALEALRHEPEPARLDRFLGDLPSDHIRKQLAKWKE